MRGEDPSSPDTHMSDDLSLETMAQAVFIVVLLLLFAPMPEGLAQVGPDRDDLFGDLMGNNLDPLSQLGRMSTPGASVPLEGAVDPQAYIVGPGDVFDISIGGAAPVLVSFPVSADGYLMLPEAGAVEIAGLPLVEARRQATEALRAQFQRVRLEVTLSQPRQFYVHVSGAVPTPGRFVATPVARVASVLYLAFADTTQAPVANLSYRPAMRSVKLIHRDGSEESVDLLRYFSTGDTDHNPYLRDGDVISLPTYDPRYDAVFVSGAVAFPGTYDYRAGDTVYDLLVLTTGQNPPQGFNRVRVSRVNDDGSEEAEIYDVSGLESLKIPVQARDQIYALPEETVRGSAAIEGWVAYPGTYSILPGRTTLRELVSRAGGLRQGALGRGAYLERATLPTPRLESSRNNRFEIVPGHMQAVPQDTAAILKTTRLANIDFLSRAYLAQELRLQSRVPINLEDVLANDGATITLENGDNVFVPRDDNMVFVFGQVNRPGYVTARPGMSVDAYVDASGGRSDMAGHLYVIEAGTGRYLDGNRVDVRSGDMIFVDRRESRADSAELQRLLYEERRADLERRSRTWQNIVQSVGAATALVTTYLLITRD